MNIEKILESPWYTIKMDLERIKDILKEVPRKPGLYNILTSTPKEVLEEIHLRKDPKHYNISNKIKNTNKLPENLRIRQKENDEYVVYSGHSYCLRQRASEHFKGSKGTACLAIYQLEELKDYEWTFQYLDLSKIHNYEDSKLFRVCLEQFYRTKIGWPILCDQ
ncbi:hypothetical protein [Aquimarina mytili]|uniref:Uncharacterized protein n=1 Tax=Aquimarina mytili TaxID=874423 RepID=A0A937D9Q9_9FLAO|nr:hypothetical protein [Aquimarina mytili]MBL0685285.1 hypothetical protein [Aquimarina mytili]